MIFLNIAGLVFLAAVLLIGGAVKLHTYRKLKKIEGLGSIHMKFEEDENKIQM